LFSLPSYPARTAARGRDRFDGIRKIPDRIPSTRPADGNSPHLGEFPHLAWRKAVLVQLSIGAGLITIGILIHAVALDLIASRVRVVVEGHAIPLRARIRLSLVVFAALATFLSHIIQIWIWAMFYIAAGEFDSMEPALYFSTVAFTTLGLGDIIISYNWRLLASFEAAAGLFMFGLSTAFLYEILREVWRRDHKQRPD
jgi:hypothetical protein